MNKRIIIESLSMDLLRVALGIHRGSKGMVKSFRGEAVKRIGELEKFKLSGYLKKLLDSSKNELTSNSKEVKDNFLMYSVLLRNYVRYYYKQ